MTITVTLEMTAFTLASFIRRSEPEHVELIKRVTKRVNEMNFETPMEVWMWLMYRYPLIYEDEKLYRARI